MNKFFEVLSNSESGSKARCGLINTGHSEIKTPVFMPVGTQGAVKAIENRNLEEMEVSIILANTYHLFIRPGMDVISNAGGLHKFINWNKSILTDSGGFQIFSLSSLKNVYDDGVEFNSHLDGSSCFLTPEMIIKIQSVFGSDIMMPLDECLPYPSDRSVVEKSISLTGIWEKKSFKAYLELLKENPGSGRLFSISQGSVYKDLRKAGIDGLSEYEFDGNAIGGLAVGEDNQLMYEITDYCTDLFPESKPRYLMGVGTPLDILECVDRGIDMFDCVLPTRNARHGRLFTTNGEINLKSSKYRMDLNSPDTGCITYTSGNFSLAYLRHLFMSKEAIGAHLATIHNIGFYMNLMKDIRTAIENKKFKEFKNNFIEKYYSFSVIK